MDKSLNKKIKNFLILSFLVFFVVLFVSSCSFFEGKKIEVFSDISLSSPLKMIGMGNEEEEEEIVEEIETEEKKGSWLNEDGERMFNVFGYARVSSDFEVDGAGINIDSVDFWEAPDPQNTLMFVTAKGNGLVEVWKYSFRGRELSPIGITGIPNGVAVDQRRNELLITESKKTKVIAFSIPGFQELRRFGKNIIGHGENNIDIMNVGGRSLAFVTEDNVVHGFDSATGERLYVIGIPVEDIETVLVDSYYRVVYIPEEKGGVARVPGVYAFNINGTQHRRSGTNLFGSSRGIFQADEEGVVLYTCPSDGLTDDGSGFIIVTDQTSPLSQFEFFNRQTWKHLGTLTINGVGNTDGIASTQKALPDHPMGIFTAVDNDSSVAIVGWDKIFEATGLSCE